MSLSRGIFVYCEQLKKGFVTRLTQDQKFDKIYEQVTELFLMDTDLEVNCIELMDARPTTEWIVPPFLRVKDLHLDDALYFQAILQPRTNEERCSVIRATAGYHRSKGSSKPKVDGKGQTEDGATAARSNAKSSKKSKDVAGSGGKDVAPVASVEPVPVVAEAVLPVTAESVTTEKRNEKTPKKRKSTSSKGKLKVTKAEAAEKKQKLKQATLTPSSHEPEQTHVTMEESSGKDGEKAKKTPPPAPTQPPTTEREANERDDDKSHASSSDAVSSTDGSSTESD